MQNYVHTYNTSDTYTIYNVYIKYFIYIKCISTSPAEKYRERNKTKDRLNKLWSIHVMEYYATGENILMMKSNQVQKLMWGVLPFLWMVGEESKGRGRGVRRGWGIEPKGPKRKWGPVVSTRKLDTVVQWARQLAFFLFSPSSFTQPSFSPWASARLGEVSTIMCARCRVCVGTQLIELTLIQGCLCVCTVCPEATDCEGVGIRHFSNSLKGILQSHSNRPSNKLRCQEEAAWPKWMAKGQQSSSYPEPKVPMCSSVLSPILTLSICTHSVPGGMTAASQEL